MKKAERLLCLLKLLQGSSVLKPKDLAERLECSERQAFRDLAAISSLGFPVYFDRDGYKLHSSAGIPPLVLAKTERLALYLGLSSPAVLRHPDLGEAAKSLKMKLSAASPDGFGPFPMPVKEASVFRQDVKFDPEIYQVLSGSIEKTRVVKIKYHALGKNKAKIAHVCPYTLFYRRHHWYLAGFAKESNEIRLFRVDRVIACEMLLERFKPEASFDLEKYLESGYELFPGSKLCTVKVRFSAGLSRLVTDTVRHPTQKTEKLSRGEVLWTIRVGNLDEVRWWLMGLGSGVEVLEPVELKEKIAEEASKLLRLYKKG